MDIILLFKKSIQKMLIIFKKNFLPQCLECTCLDLLIIPDETIKKKQEERKKFFYS